MRAPGLAFRSPAGSDATVALPQELVPDEYDDALGIADEKVHKRAGTFELARSVGHLRQVWSFLVAELPLRLKGFLSLRPTLLCR